MVEFDIDQQEIIHIREEIDNLEEANILEIGCGSGRLTKLLAPHCKHITGIEPDAEQIRNNTEQNKVYNISYLQASATELPFDDGSFDGVIFSLSLCCIKPVEQIMVALRQARRVLRPGGYLVNFMPTTLRFFDAGYLWYYIDQDSINQVVDQSVFEARKSLKQLVFNHRELEFFEERRVETRWQYDTTDEMEQKWNERYEEHVVDDTEEKREKFQQELSLYLEDLELIFPMVEEMQILRVPEN